ncbi:MAG: alpha/beta hydrolase [Planctomycetes bacterium]|nr:alpha/beta hydrolase [Planctomycetota bacterium]
MTPSPRAARLSMRTPRFLRAALGCRRPVVREGQTLDRHVQWLLHLDHMMGTPPLTGPSVEASRAGFRTTSRLLAPRDACPSEDRTVEGAAGPLPARLYVPPGADSGLLLFFHGGGWVIGDLETHDSVCKALAVRAGRRVLAVDYRLAPEHPFPAAADDALAAFRWAVDHASELGVDPTRIAVGGDSAGGNLAATVAQRARQPGPGPCFQLLLYPGMDFVDKAPSHETFGKGFLLTSEDIRWFQNHYLSDPAQASDPKASPGRAKDLSGLAPACVMTAGYDPLRDEGRSYARRLQAAGVAAEDRCYPGLVHGFMHLAGAIPAAAAALEDAAQALRRV